MNYTLAQFQAAFPEFANMQQSQFTSLLAFATPFFTNTRVWGGFLNIGLGLFIAHEATIENLTASTQPTPGAIPDAVGADDVTMERIGDEQIQRDQNLLSMEMKDPFMRTIYGQRYRRLQKMVGKGGVIV